MIVNFGQLNSLRVYSSLLKIIDIMERGVYGKKDLMIKMCKISQKNKTRNVQTAVLTNPKAHKTLSQSLRK